MPANAKWPDFQLASKLRYFMGSSAPESTPSQTTSSPQLDEAKREELQSAQDNDQQLGSHARIATMAEIDNEPIEGMEDVEDYEHEGDSAGVDVDFGDLEMFDSNASQLPFLSQEPQSLTNEEPVFPTPSGSTKRDRHKKKKNRDSVQATDFVVDEELASSASSKRKKSKKKPLQDSEIAGNQSTETNPDAPSATPASGDAIQGSNTVDDATTEMNALDLAPIPSTQKKKKRKPSDSAEGKRHKKKRGLEDGDRTIIQQTQDEIENADARDTATSFLHLDKNATGQHLGTAIEDDTTNAEEQMSPSIARARRRSQTGEETRSRENSAPLRAQVAPMAPMAIDSLSQEFPRDEASNSQNMATDEREDDRDVEDLAREAWREHISSQSGNAVATNEAKPHHTAFGDSAQAEEESAITPSRRRSARAKKSKPVLLVQALEATDTPAKKSRRILEELPSPSANTPKPRARAKRATKKRPEPTLQPSGDDSENAGAEEPVKRSSSNLENYTQGRFTDAEFDGINRAIEAFRNEYGLTQVEVNEVKPRSTMPTLFKAFASCMFIKIYRLHESR
jgi:hypothetical protein